MSKNRHLTRNPNQSALPLSAVKPIYGSADNHQRERTQQIEHWIIDAVVSYRLGKTMQEIGKSHNKNRHEISYIIENYGPSVVRFILAPQTVEFHLANGTVADTPLWAILGHDLHNGHWFDREISSPTANNAKLMLETMTKAHARAVLDHDGIYSGQKTDFTLFIEFARTYLDGIKFTTQATYERRAFERRAEAIRNLKPLSLRYVDFDTTPMWHEVSEPFTIFSSFRDIGSSQTLTLKQLEQRLRQKQNLIGPNHIGKFFRRDEADLSMLLLFCSRYPFAVELERTTRNSMIFAYCWAAVHGWREHKPYGYRKFLTPDHLYRSQIDTLVQNFNPDALARLRLNLQIIKDGLIQNGIDTSLYLEAQFEQFVHVRRSMTEKTQKLLNPIPNAPQTRH